METWRYSLEFKLLILQFKYVLDIIGATLHWKLFAIYKAIWMRSPFPSCGWASLYVALSFVSHIKGQHLSLSPWLRCAQMLKSVFNVSPYDLEPHTQFPLGSCLNKYQLKSPSLSMISTPTEVKPKQVKGERKILVHPSVEGHKINKPQGMR